MRYLVVFLILIAGCAQEPEIVVEEVVVTEEVEVEVVSEMCIAALETADEIRDLADELHLISLQKSLLSERMAEVYLRGFRASNLGDVEGLREATADTNEVNEKTRELTSQIEAITPRWIESRQEFQEQAEECRGR